MSNWEAAKWHEREAEIARRQQAKAALLAEALHLREAQVRGRDALLGACSGCLYACLFGQASRQSNCCEQMGIWSAGHIVCGAGLMAAAHRPACVGAQHLLLSPLAAVSLIPQPLQMDEDKWNRLEMLRAKRMAAAQAAAEQTNEFARHTRPNTQHSQVPHACACISPVHDDSNASSAFLLQIAITGIEAWPSVTVADN